METANGFREIALNDGGERSTPPTGDCTTNSGRQNGQALRPTSLKLIMPEPMEVVASSKGSSKRAYTLNHHYDVGGGDDNQASSEGAGYMRHIVALLALSSIVLANMNRQAYNQSLSSMIKPVQRRPDPDLPATTEQATTVYESVDTTLGSIVITEVPEYYSQLHNRSSELNNDLPAASPSTMQNDAEDDRFEWDLNRVSLLQSAFAYGYTPFMIPGGRLCEIYGAKWIVFLSGFGSALCSALTPFLADYSFPLLVSSRILMGVCQTGVSPALYALLTRWLPVQESNVYLPMMKVGVMVGFMFGSSISGFFHWRTTFHLVALISFLWSLLWMLLISSDPQEHKFIGHKELKYIQTELQRNNKGRKMSVGSARRRSAPWFNILTNRVVLSFMFAKFTVKLSTDAQTIQLPKYLNDVFQVSQELNGTLNSLNFAIQAIFTGFVAWTAKEFIGRKLGGMSKTQVRRLFQGVCNFGMASAYILISFNMSSLGVVCAGIVLLSVSSMFGAGGEAMTPVDLSTEYSASIMAIANSVANFSGMVLPPLISYILDGQATSSSRWNMVWWTVGAIITSGGLVYTCLVKGELQEFRPDEGAGNSGKRQSSTSAAGFGAAATSADEKTAPLPLVPMVSKE